jgi:hypothetical protein
MLWKPWRDFEPFLADVEDLALGLVEDLRHRSALRIERRGGDLVARRHQLSQHRALAHDLGVAADVGGARHALRQGVEVGQPAAFLGLAQALQLLEHGDHVGRLGGIHQRRHRREDHAVLEAVEVRFGQQVADPVPCAVVEQEAAEHALLGLDRVRRHAQPGDLVVGARLRGKLGRGVDGGHREIIVGAIPKAGGQAWGWRGEMRCSKAKGPRMRPPWLQRRSFDSGRLAEHHDLDLDDHVAVRRHRSRCARRPSSAVRSACAPAT